MEELKQASGEPKGSVSQRDPESMEQPVRPAIGRNLPGILRRAKQDIGSLRPHEIRILHGAIGNQAVARLIASAGQQKRKPLQPKLTIGAPDDAYEKEADSAAERVMSNSAGLQRKCACGGNSEEECSDCRTKRFALQRLSSGGDAGAEAASIVEDVLATPGQPLAGLARETLEPGFGQDFSHVRVHDDSKAAESAAAVNAHAYTVGDHIVFGQGQYTPGTAAGQHLLAHELTHTIQQTGGTPLNGHLARQAQTENSLVQRDPVGGQAVASGSEQAASGAATPPGAGAGPTSPNGSTGTVLIVEDNATNLSPGQVKKSDFLSRLRQPVSNAVQEALAGSPLAAAGSAVIEPWLQRYAGQSAQELERSVRTSVPGVANVADAGSYIPLIAAQVARAVGDSEAVQGARNPISKIGGMLFKGKEGGAHVAEDPVAIQAQLGSGETLEGGLQGRMNAAFGYDFSGVRVHKDNRAARLSADLNARAFTIGRSVAFGAGEYQPGSPIGDALIAHELAHVVQQGRTSAHAPLQKGEAGNVSLEEDADVSAVRAVVSLWGGLKGGLANVSRNALPALKSGLRLQTCKTKPAVPTTHGPDQRAAIAPGGAAAIPDAGLAQQIGYELDPGSRPAPAPPVPAGAPPGAPPPAPVRIPWDGKDGAGGAVAARAAMQAELFAAYDAYLTHFRPETVAALARPRVPLTAPAAPAGAAPAGGAPAPPPTGVVDIANQAREVLEARYSTSMNAAASSPAQLSDRAPRKATAPGQNIFDASSEADRSAFTGDANLAPAVAFWLFENDVPGAAGAAGARPFATGILAAHHYSVEDDPDSQFRWAVANAYAAAASLAPNNARQLIDYRMTGWSERGNTGITLLSSFTPGANPNRAELQERWEVFRTATHESLHLRAHPAFVAADQGRGTMAEGFIEMFAVATLNTDVLPRARAGTAEPLRRTVEGALSPAAPDATLITDRVSPAQYVAHRAQAERIRDGGAPPVGAPHAGVGETAVRAAFFEGHVEYLGLTPTGAQLAALPAAGAVVRTRIPGGIAGLNDLARRSGVPRATIERDNPGIGDALPATAVLAGCREHWVVGGETRANVAAQNGVSEADLVRANPDIPTDPATNAWPALAAGQKILIPVH